MSATQLDLDFGALYVLGIHLVYQLIRGRNLSFISSSHTWYPSIVT